MINRYKIMHDTKGSFGVPGMFVVLDRLKLHTCIRDKRATHLFFDSKEKAQGYLVAKTGDNKYGK